MDKRPWWKHPGVWSAAALLAIAAAIIGLTFFAPEGSTTRNESIDMNAPDLETLGSGTWQGDAGHRSTGSVMLLRDADGPFLFFEDFEQTDGPDVYLYLSTSQDGDFGDGDVWKVPVPGGAKDGQATVRGDFRVPVPAEVDLDRVASAITWCDRFGVPFGHAGLR